MKIALFLVRNMRACHYSLFGYRETLTRMGHEVLECPFPGNQVSDVEAVRRHMPSIEDLNRCDLVFVTYMEYTQPWLQEIYGLDAWKKISVPIIARYDESMDRGDLYLPGRMPVLQVWATHHSFPAAQDAKRFGGQWVPFGADTTIFKPRPEEQKKFPLGFIGSLYPQRRNYLNSLVQFISQRVEFRIGPVQAVDLSGFLERESTELLARNYSQIDIFFCLPPLSRLIVEKVFDIIASGTFVMYPRLFGAAVDNNFLFDDKKHLAYYELGNFFENAKQVIHYLEHKAERDQIAKEGCKFVHANYTLDRMLQRILSMVQKGKSGNEAIPETAGAASD